MRSLFIVLALVALSLFPPPVRADSFTPRVNAYDLAQLVEGTSRAEVMPLDMSVNLDPSKADELAAAKMAPDGGVTIGSALIVGKQVITDVKTIQALEKSGDTTKMYMAIASLVAFVLKFLIDLALALSKRLTKFARYIPWFTMAAGVIVGLCTRFAGGASLLDSIILGGGPPLSMLCHAVIEALKPAEPKAAQS